MYITITAGGRETHSAEPLSMIQKTGRAVRYGCCSHDVGDRAVEGGPRAEALVFGRTRGASTHQPSIPAAWSSSRRSSGTGAVHAIREPVRG
jgi:hypothetical protein